MDIRERILEAFLELALSAGFRGTAISDVCARTGISKRTVYRYFQSKDEIVEAVVNELSEAIGKEIDAIVASDKEPLEKILLSIQIYIQQVQFAGSVIVHDLVRYYPRIWQRMENLHMEKTRLVAEVLFAECKERCCRDTVPVVFISALLAAVREVLNPPFILANNLTLDEAMFGLYDIFLYGVLSEEERKRTSPLSLFVPGHHDRE